MDIEYKLYVGNLHTQNTNDDFKDVVFSAEYTYSGFATINNIRYSFGLTRSAVLVESLEDVNKDGFINFSDLTENMVSEWIMNSFLPGELQQMQDIIRMKIEEDSSLVVRRPPWVTITQGVPSPVQEEIQKEKQE